MYPDIDSNMASIGLEKIGIRKYGIAPNMLAAIQQRRAMKNASFLFNSFTSCDSLHTSSNINPDTIVTQAVITNIYKSPSL